MLDLNPTSSELWNILGNSLFELDRVEEAAQAFARAERLNESDPCPREGLAWVYARKKDYRSALGKIAEALARSGRPLPGTAAPEAGRDPRPPAPTEATRTPAGRQSGESRAKPA